MSRGITGYISFSDIPILDKITQNVGMAAGRNLIIDVLRECFSRDREFHWVPDPWGFNKTPSALGLDADAGVFDDATTRLYIGGTHRYDISYLPSIVVRQTGSSYKPVSFNQNRWELEYTDQQLIDGYGVTTYVNRPSSWSFVGMWDSTYEIKITSKSLLDTCELADTIMLHLQTTSNLILQQNGLFIRSVRSSGEQTETYGSNDPLFTVSITAEALSGWRRTIPISNLVERIQICLELDMSGFAAGFVSGASTDGVSVHTSTTLVTFADDSDPYPQYTTEGEAADAAPVQSVNGEDGNVILNASDVGADPAGTAAGLIAALDAADVGADGYGTAATLVDALADAVSLRSFGITIDGGTDVITTGIKRQVRVPFSGTIVDWTLLADETGSIVMDVWRSTFAASPPVLAGSITGTEKPTIVSAAKSEDAVLTTWNTTVTAGDVFLFVVDSVSLLTGVTLTITVDTA